MMSVKRRSIKIDDRTYIEVVSEKYNKLVRRYEMVGFVHHLGRGTLSRTELREILSKEFNKPPENIYIRKIVGEYGINRSLIRVNIYDEGGRANEFEPEYVIKRHSE
ncbi:MAG: hypothetical protein N3G48_07140 [Sulfolobales archaeon]|nr:hypothetical protein [Sulfolobales archaeon]